MHLGDDSLMKGKNRIRKPVQLKMRKVWNENTNCGSDSDETFDCFSVMITDLSGGYVCCVGILYHYFDLDSAVSWIKHPLDAGRSTQLHSAWIRYC